MLAANVCAQPLQQLDTSFEPSRGALASLMQ
jgi:hypothetical protein